MFKIGDKVKCIREDYSRGVTAEPGDILTVSEMDFGGEHAFYADFKGVNFNGYNSHFELVQPEAAPGDFQAGNVVRCIVKDSYLNHRVEPGDLLIVTRRRGELFYASLGGEEIICYTERFVRVDPSETPAAPQETLEAFKARIAGILVSSLNNGEDVDAEDLLALFGFTAAERTTYVLEPLTD